MDVSFHVVLVEPLIPQNTGNIGRLTAATNAVLHVIHPLGFEISDARVKRAGLDYWPWVRLEQHENFEAFEKWKEAQAPGANLFFFSKKAVPLYTEARFSRGDVFVFGKETSGLSPELLANYPGQSYRLPVFNENVRSLNVANAAAAVLYEAIRQTGLAAGK